MQIGPKMAMLQEKKPKMDPKNQFFLKNLPGFLAFETSSSNRPFWLKQIYRDIKFVLSRLPGRCELNSFRLKWNLCPPPFWPRWSYKRRQKEEWKSPKREIRDPERGIADPEDEGKEELSFSPSHFSPISSYSISNLLTLLKIQPRIPNTLM